MSKRNPETLNLVMDYAQLMEACAAYVAVQRPAVRDPEAAYRLRPAQPVPRTPPRGVSGGGARPWALYAGRNEK